MLQAYYDEAGDICMQAMQVMHTNSPQKICATFTVLPQQRIHEGKMSTLDPCRLAVQRESFNLYAVQNLQNASKEASR